MAAGACLASSKQAKRVLEVLLGNVIPLERRTVEVLRETRRGLWERVRHFLQGLGRALGLSAAPAAPPLPPLRTVSDAASVPVPTRIASWKVLGVLGEGTSSTVYRVVPEWAPSSPRQYALKLHASRLAGEKHARSRFLREIQVMKKIRHRNVVELVDFGEEQGQLYLVMELVEGLNLRESLERNRPQLKGKLDWAIQITRALEATHQRGIVHRDLKPENILTTRIGTIKLADFGLARAIMRGDLAVTHCGWLVGTPAYIAPETLLGNEPDHRCDLYSLGVILYEMFTGAMPYEAHTIAEFIDAHLQVAPIPPRTRQPSLPRDLERVILRLLRKCPTDRFPDAAAVRHALEDVLAREVGVPNSFEGQRRVA